MRRESAQGSGSFHFGNQCEEFSLACASRGRGRRGKVAVGEAPTDVQSDYYTIPGPRGVPGGSCRTGGRSNSDGKGWEFSCVRANRGRERRGKVMVAKRPTFLHSWVDGARGGNGRGGSEFQFGN